MAAAAEKLACLLIFMGIAILVDSQVVRPYTLRRDRGRGSGFRSWPRFATPSGLSFRRGNVHRPIFRPRQQPRLRTTVLQQTLVVNDNTNLPGSRRNRRPSGRRRHTGRGGAARNSPNHIRGFRSSQFSPRGRSLGSRPLPRRPAQSFRIPTHRPIGQNALRQRLRQRTHPTTNEPIHGTGHSSLGINNLARIGSHGGPVFHRQHMGHSGTGLGLLGAGASHNSPASHGGAMGHGGAAGTNLHNSQQTGGLGLLGIDANQLIPGAGFGTGELGILGAGMGADGGLAGVIAALMGSGLGAGGSLGGGSRSVADGAGAGAGIGSMGADGGLAGVIAALTGTGLGTGGSLGGASSVAGGAGVGAGRGSSHAAGGAGGGTGTGVAASGSRAGAGTSGSGVATGAGARTSTGVNAGTGADLLTAGLGLGNILGPEIVQLNNALNSLLGQTGSGNTQGVSQTSASGGINPQIVRQLLGDNRREGLLPGDVGERVKARLRVSHPHLLPDA